MRSDELTRGRKRTAVIARARGSCVQVGRHHERRGATSTARYRELRWRAVRTGGGDTGLAPESALDFAPICIS